MVDGMSDVDAAGLAEHQEAGAARRTHQLVEELATTGALTWNRPDTHTNRWRVRRLAGLTAGLGLGAAAAVARHLPVRMLSRMIGLLPSSPFTWHVYRSSRTTIVANLLSSSLADEPARWLRWVAMGSAAVAPANGCFNFLGTILARGRLDLVADRVVDRPSADRVAAQVAEAGPLIGVFLHGGLYAAVPNVLRSRGHKVVRVVVPRTHGTYVSEASGRLTDLWGETSEMTVEAGDAFGSAAMVRHLKEGRNVFIALDRLAFARPTGTAYMLGRALPRNDGPAWLAVRSGRPVALWTTYIDRGRIQITASLLLYPDPTLSPQERVARLSQQLYEQAEKAIRAHPEAWACWSYLSGATGGGEVAETDLDQ